MTKWIMQTIQLLQAKGTKYDLNFTRTDIHLHILTIF